MTAINCHSRNLHLDMCFNLVLNTSCSCSEALPESFLAMLKKRKFELIDVSQEGVIRHYCNNQCLCSDRVFHSKTMRDVNSR
jgi:N-dimethylarginine dimethylaminohydrolase